MATKINVSRSHAECLDYHTIPQDQGQIVEISYACDERGLYRKTHDRSDRTTGYKFAPYNARATEDQLRFEPQNGRLPRHNTWREIKE